MTVHFGIHYAQRRGISMLLSEYAQFFLATLRSLRTNYRQEEVMKLIKSGFTGLTEDETMDLENYVRQYGIDRYKWQKPFTGKDEKIPAKIVCVRNKKNKKDWIAFICTNPEISEKEIIRIYGKRWQIEVFFKTCKSYLNLISECHSLTYDALTAHVAIVFTRYLMIAMEQRRSEDSRTLGEIFFFFTDELRDITFGESFQIILTAMIDSVCAIFQPTETQLELFIEMFAGRLPGYIRNSLAKSAMAA